MQRTKTSLMFRIFNVKKSNLLSLQEPLQPAGAGHDTKRVKKTKPKEIPIPEIKVVRPVSTRDAEHEH